MSCWFSLGADQMDAFKARLKLGTNVFRHQFRSIDSAADVTEAGFRRGIIDG